MSDIDRIAERLIRAILTRSSIEQMEDEARAALLEYGAIVREECAKAAENGRFLHYEAPDAKFGRAFAAAIRRMNDNV